MNNYTYAVGGKDNYQLPVLGEAGVDNELIAVEDNAGKADAKKKIDPKGKAENSGR